jgi:hypothetical protein
MTPKDKEEKFWTDELVAEAIRYYLMNDDFGDNEEMKGVQKFKQSKKQPVLPEGILAFKEVDAIIYKHDCLNYQEWVKDCLGWHRKIWSVQNGADVLTVGDKVNVGRINGFVIKNFTINDGYLNLITEGGTGFRIVSNSIKKVTEEKPIKEQLREKLQQWLKELE